MNEIISIADLDINISGLIVGVCNYLTIVIARRLCIIGEYYFTKWFWIAFLVIGIATIGISLYTPNVIWATILGITGFTYLWGIHEIIEQEERVKKGWYPQNPKRIKS